MLQYFFILIAGTCFSQNLDSLKSCLSTAKHDSDKVKALIEISEICPEEEMFQYAEPAMKICEKLLVREPNSVHYKYNLTRALVVVGQYYGNTGKTKQALQTYDRALRIQKEIGDTAGMAVTYNNVGFIEYRKGNLRKALGLFIDASKIQLSYRNYTGYANSINNIASAYHHLGEIDKAISFHASAIKFQEQSKDSVRLAISYNNIALLYDEMGDIARTFEYLRKALVIHERKKNKMAESNVLNNIGTIYYERGYSKEAMTYYVRALKIQREIDDKHGMGLVLNNIGNAYRSQKDPANAEKALMESLAIRKEIEDNYGVAETTGNLGNLFLETDPEKAMSYYIEAKDISERFDFKKIKLESLNELGKIYFKKNELSKSEDACLKSLAISRDLRLPKNMYESAEILKRVYVKQNRVADALKMSDLYITMHDSLTKQIIFKETLKNQIQYDFDRQSEHLKSEEEKRNAVFTEQARIKDLQIKQRNVMLIGIGSLLILLSIIGWLVLRQNKLKASQQATQLEQKLLRLQMNPHFIFNALTSIEGFIYENKPELAGKYLSDFSKLMRMTLENSREDLISLDEEVKMLEYYLKVHQLYLEDKFNFNIKIDEEVDPSSILIPPMLFQPFVENAIKHGVADIEHGEIQLSFKMEGEKLMVQIRDNGKGLEEIFQRKEHTSLATLITKERLALLRFKHGKILFDIRSNVPHGTVVNFSIPVA
jgi:tetratricopeptide (TPR) repeat protein